MKREKEDEKKRDGEKKRRGRRGMEKKEKKWRKGKEKKGGDYIHMHTVTYLVTLQLQCI